MKTVTTIATIQEHIHKARMDGRTVGLVPTMGYLHEGHAALVDTARRECDVVVASLFVNPLQFGPNEDFDAYPRDARRDEKILEQHGCDLLFAPSVEEMYPVPMATTVDLPELAKVLCGHSRPTHFRGVTTVVTKLFNIVQPDYAYFGQKDGQQVAVIRRMVQDLNLPLSIVTVPTVREPDGLAKSSRNIYLNEEERQHATILYQALNAAKNRLLDGERDARVLSSEMRAIINNEPGVTLDYAEIVNLDDLSPVQTVHGSIMLAVAAYLGKARLIDNFQLRVSDAHDDDNPAAGDNDTAATFRAAVVDLYAPQQAHPVKR